MTGRLVYQARSRSLLEHTGFACRLWQNFAPGPRLKIQHLSNSRPDLQRHNRHNCCGLPVAVVLRCPWRGNVAVPDSLAIEAAVSARRTLAADLTTREKTMIESALRDASGRVSGAKGAAAILGMPRQLSSRS